MIHMDNPIDKHSAKQVEKTCGQRVTDNIPIDEIEYLLASCVLLLSSEKKKN
jgi:hypothetical protein